MAIPIRKDIQPVLQVVMRLLTSSSTHPHDIKVMLVGGKVGRVQAIAK
jgi:uncharacterized repeat protein (TIGR03833 family)